MKRAIKKQPTDFTKACTASGCMGVCCCPIYEEREEKHEQQDCGVREGSRPGQQGEEAGFSPVRGDGVAGDEDLGYYQQGADGTGV